MLNQTFITSFSASAGFGIKVLRGLLFNPATVVYRLQAHKIYIIEGNTYFKTTRSPLLRAIQSSSPQDRGQYRLQALRIYKILEGNTDFKTTIIVFI